MRGFLCVPRQLLVNEILCVSATGSLCEVARSFLLLYDFYVEANGAESVVAREHC